MEVCIAEQGLWFLVAGGVAIADETGALVEWHRRFKSSGGVRTSRSNSGASRLRKAAFRPLHVEALWFSDADALTAAVQGKGLVPFQTGLRQPPLRQALKVHPVARSSRSTLSALGRWDWWSRDTSSPAPKAGDDLAGARRHDVSAASTSQGVTLTMVSRCK